MLRTICIAIFYRLTELVCPCRMVTTTALSLYSLFTHPADSAYSIQCPLSTPVFTHFKTRELPACRPIYLRVYKTIQAKRPSLDVASLSLTVSYRKRATLHEREKIKKITERMSSDINTYDLKDFTTSVRCLDNKADPTTTIPLVVLLYY